VGGQLVRLQRHRLDLYGRMLGVLQVLGDSLNYHFSAMGWDDDAAFI
jgi:hypothetical protein